MNSSIACNSVFFICGTRTFCGKFTLSKDILTNGPLKFLPTDTLTNEHIFRRKDMLAKAQMLGTFLLLSHQLRHLPNRAAMKCQFR